MRDYELVFIVSPEVPDENVGTIIERVSDFITSRGGTVTKVDPWGRRKLAYPIDGHREGNYVLLQFRLDPRLTGELDTSLRISEDIIRHLLVRLN